MDSMAGILTFDLNIILIHWHIRLSDCSYTALKSVVDDVTRGTALRAVPLMTNPASMNSSALRTSLILRECTRNELLGVLAGHHPVSSG